MIIFFNLRKFKKVKTELDYMKTLNSSLKSVLKMIISSFCFEIK